MRVSEVLDPFQHLDWPDSLILSVWWIWNDVFLYFNFNSWLLMLLSNSSYVNKSYVCVYVCILVPCPFSTGVFEPFSLCYSSLYPVFQTVILHQLHTLKSPVPSVSNSYHILPQKSETESKGFHFSKASDINSCKYRQISR